MVVVRVRLREFRGYESVEVSLAAGMTVVHGRNGAGKTNLLEGLYFACTGRSCRTTNEREVVRFGASAARAEVDVEDRDGAHELAVGFQPGEPKRFRVDGAPVERLTDSENRPLVAVFLPDRLGAVKGPAAPRPAGGPGPGAGPIPPRPPERGGGGEPRPGAPMPRRSRNATPCSHGS